MYILIYGVSSILMGFYSFMLELMRQCSLKHHRELGHDTIILVVLFQREHIAWLQYDKDYFLKLDHDTNIMVHLFQVKPRSWLQYNHLHFFHLVYDYLIQEFHRNMLYQILSCHHRANDMVLVNNDIEEIILKYSLYYF